MKTFNQSDKTSDSRANAPSQRVAHSVETLTNNRPSAVTQRKLQEAASAKVTVPVVQRVANRQSNSRGVAQRNKWKTFKNVITLGIRKAYVNHKRNKESRETPEVEEPQVVQQVQIDDSEESFIQAYKACRFYANVYDMNNLQLIEQNGMLIKRERDQMAANLGIPAPIGMSERFRDAYAGDENKGIFMGPKKFRIDSNSTFQNGAGDVRLYLTKDQSVIRGMIRENGQTVEKRPDIVGQQGLYGDQRFGGGFISKVSVQANQVSTQSIDVIIANGGAKLGSILDAIASHYPMGTAPDHAVLLAFLQQFTDNNIPAAQRRLSNAQLDNADFTNPHSVNNT